MPRYVYECTKCRHSYEKREGWDAKPRQRCPMCRAVSQRIPAPPAIVFKGSGWYSTDNRRSLRDGAEELQHGKDGEDRSSGESGSDESGSDEPGSGESGRDRSDGRSERADSKQPARAESTRDD